MYYFCSCIDRTKGKQIGAFITKNNPLSSPLNPGGEIRMCPMDSIDDEDMEPEKFYTAEEMKALGY